MVKAVLFDLDGTLADTLADLAAAANSALEKCGYPAREPEEYRMLIGDGLRNMLKRALPEGADNREVDRMLPYYFERYDEYYADKTALYGGVGELLKELKAGGIKLGVVTNKTHDMANKLVEALCPGVFGIVLGQREGVPIKPDPAQLFAGMERLGAGKENCAFVGDSGVDINTAKNAGVLSVGVTWGYRSREELEGCGADFVVDEAEEILKIVTTGKTGG